MRIMRILVVAVGVLILVMAVIALQSYGLSQRDIHILLMVGTGGAMLYAIFFSDAAKMVTRSVPAKRGSLLWLYRNVGLGLIWLGALVVVGNRTGAMPTIPYGGAVLLTVGAGLLTCSLVNACRPGTPVSGPQKRPRS